MVEKEQQWPGPQGGARWQTVQHVQSQVEATHSGRGKKHASRLVTVTIDTNVIELYRYRGSSLTIILHEDYRLIMDKVVSAESRLRVWGSKVYMDVNGMLRTTIVSEIRPAKRTWV